MSRCYYRGSDASIQSDRITDTQPRGLRRRVALRILPFLCLLYLVAYLDRANIAFAGAAMRHDLGFSDAMFGFGAGIFFIGYFVLEIPGALIVQRSGARRWIARILITWGIVTALVGMVRTPTQFYIARFCLGAAEAGFFPGLLVYLNEWFCEQDRAGATSMFSAAAPVAIALGAPISALILKFHPGHLAGWRWLFILEGVPAIILGFVTLFYLTDFPDQAQWLTEPEARWLVKRLRFERQQRQIVPSERWWKALLLPNVLLLTLAEFFACVAGYGFILWLPSILEHLGGASRTIGYSGALRAALPFSASVAGAVILGTLADKSNKPRYYACASLLAAGIFLSAATRQQSPGQTLLWFTLAGAAVYGWVGPFWVLPTQILSEAAAAAAIGMINSIGNLGGFVGPFLVGYLLSRGWSFGETGRVLAATYGLAAAFTWLGSRPIRSIPMQKEFRSGEELAE